MKRWITTILLALAVAAAVSVVVWRHVLPMYHVSDFYRRYHNADGIAASYIHNFPVNDTVFVDVTLLEATDSMWHTLMKDFNIPTPDSDLQQFIDAGENLVVTKLVDKTHYSRPAAPCSSNCEIMAISYTTHSISVFHTVDAGERHAILYFNLDKSTNQ